MPLEKPPFGQNTGMASNNWAAAHFFLVMVCMVFLVLTLILEMMGGNIEIYSMVFSLLLIFVISISLLMVLNVIEKNRRNLKIELFIIGALIVFSVVTKITVPSADLFYYSVVILFFMGVVSALMLGLGNLRGRQIMLSYEETKIWPGLAVMVGIVLLVTLVRITFSAVYGVPQSSLHTAIPFSAVTQPAGDITSSPFWLFASGYARGFLENTALICFLGGVLIITLRRFSVRGVSYFILCGIVAFFVVGIFGSLIHTGIYNPEYQSTVFLFTWLVFSIFGFTMLSMMTSFATTNAHGLLDGLQELGNAGFVAEQMFMFAVLIIIGAFATFMWLGRKKM